MLFYSDQYRKGTKMLERYIETDKFLRLPLSRNEYFINLSGIVKDNKNNEILSLLDTDGDLAIEIDWIDGKKFYKLLNLIAFTFKPVKIPFRLWSKIVAITKDGNKQNIHPANLIWKFPIGFGIDEYNGFAFIPAFTRYMINKDGVVYDTTTMKMQKAHFNKGYYSFALIPDIGPRTSLKRHRGLCLAFTDYPANVDDLQVNHINGIVGDDKLNNLEWVTCSENRIHAIKSGLTLINKPILVRDLHTGAIEEFYSLKYFCSKFNLNEKIISKCLSKHDENLILNNKEIYYKNLEHRVQLNTIKRKILVRDIRTAEVTEYDSIVSCAKILGISKNIINWRINTPTSCLYKDYRQFKRKSDKNPWYESINYEQELLDYSWAKNVLIRDSVTGEVIEYETQRLAAEGLGISESTIHKWLSLENQPIFKTLKLNKFIQIKNKSDKSEWRISKDPIMEYLDNLSSKVVLVRNINTGVIDEYPSAVMCARALGLKTTNLNFRLKTKGQKTYQGNLQFKYKNDKESFLNC